MNEKESIRDLKISIGADILEQMHDDGIMPFEQDNGIQPITDKTRLVRTMAHYFSSNNYKYELQEAGCKSMPNVKYWKNHLDDIRVELRNRRKYLKFVRYKDGFGGVWKFCDKAEYHNALRREAAENNTRIERYNEEVEDGREKWQLDLPPASPVPSLPPYKKNVAQGYF